MRDKFSEEPAKCPKCGEVLFWDNIENFCYCFNGCEADENFCNCEKELITEEEKREQICRWCK